MVNLQHFITVSVQKPLYITLGTFCKWLNDHHIHVTWYLDGKCSTYYYCKTPKTLVVPCYIFKSLNDKNIWMVFNGILIQFTTFVYILFLKLKNCGSNMIFWLNDYHHETKSCGGFIYSFLFVFTLVWKILWIYCKNSGINHVTLL